ncbi:hypothetical protein [Methylotuvimicrobium buryatense]|uniref:hypothetical protein n=1 Tax=Methylotuvimicrobium buryatense TaxID=95641 RepID=UPI00034B7D02|nr:hypothetical protein [Methylotuvimicrobium buryatense]
MNTLLQTNKAIDIKIGFIQNKESPQRRQSIALRKFAQDSTYDRIQLLQNNPEVKT